MSDAMTTEERAKQIVSNVRLVDARDWLLGLVAEVDRLQAELLATVGRHADVVKQVARLRARNEALEKVAKAAVDIMWDEAMEFEGRIDAKVYLTVDQLTAMRAALSALNPSGPNSSGGET